MNTPLTACALAVLLGGCATSSPPAPAAPPIDPTVYADFRIVPRAPGAAVFPALAEHVWARSPADRVFVTIKVVNYKLERVEHQTPVVAAGNTKLVASTKATPPPPVRVPVVLTAEVHFAFNKHNLDDKSVKALEALAAQAGADLAAAEIVVDGYTDSFGSDAYNQRLSERRAASVREFLLARGATPNRVAIVGKGESQPTSSNKTPAGRAENRRAIVHLTTD